MMNNLNSGRMKRFQMKMVVEIKSTFSTQILLSHFIFNFTFISRSTISPYINPDYIISSQPLTCLFIYL